MLYVEAEERFGWVHDAKGIILKEVSWDKQIVLPNGDSGRGKGKDLRQTVNAGVLSVAGPAYQEKFPTSDSREDTHLESVCLFFVFTRCHLHEIDMCEGPRVCMV